MPVVSVRDVVTLDEAAPATTSLSSNTSNGTATAGSNFTAGSGTVSFATGETQKTARINLTDDARTEGFEPFLVTLGRANGLPLFQNQFLVVLAHNDTVAARRACSSSTTARRRACSASSPAAATRR